LYTALTQGNVWDAPDYESSLGIRIMDSRKQQLLLRKSGSLLARRAYSRGELRDRLLRIAGKNSVDPLLDRLEQLNLLNDADYAYNFALRRLADDGWGPRKVRDLLLRRQVALAIVEQALERVCSEMGSERALENYMEKYRNRRGLPADLKGLRRLFSHLRQRGFEEAEVLGVLSRLVSPALWQRFETGE
jgi:regulatory protein